MEQAFLGRQPIFDRELKVYAYELLFRPGPGDSAGPLDDSTATASVIVNAFVELGIDGILGPHKAFINVNREFLLDGRPVPLPHERVVLEVLETVAVDRQLVDAVLALKQKGFGIALDDFTYEPSWEPLLDAAHFVKVDVRLTRGEALQRLLGQLRGRSLKLLAEKVETREELEMLRDLGFDYFQGYFLERPKLISGKRAPAAQLPTLRLLAALNQPDVEVRELEQLIARDVRMSYKLLRSINSAMFALPLKVESLRQAIVMLGLQAIARWASMVVMSSFDERPSELLVTSLLRARACELLARAAGDPAPDVYFTTGLLSTLDALMEMEMAEVLASLPLSKDVADALLHRRGLLGEALACVVACERWELQSARFGTLSEAAIGRAYADALAWSMEASATLLTKPGPRPGSA